jgi:hypothetical protein
MRERERERERERGKYCEKGATRSTFNQVFCVEFKDFCAFDHENVEMVM